MENNTARIEELVSATMETTKEKTKIQRRRGRREHHQQHHQQHPMGIIAMFFTQSYLEEEKDK